MKQYKKGDKVILDFSRCDNQSDETPTGLFFPVSWRDALQGKIATIDQVSVFDAGIYRITRYVVKGVFAGVFDGRIVDQSIYIDEYCILDQRSNFDTSGLEELI